MHIWTIENWKKYYSDDTHIRIGLRLRIDKGVDSEVRRACLEFCKWLRTEYYFPIRVLVYIKSSKQIKALDGEKVSAIFSLPADRMIEPHIRVSAGDYYDLLKKLKNQDDALATILRSVAHELTHYFQWINDIKLTPIGEERQATMYSGYIIDEYAETREHP